MEGIHTNIARVRDLLEHWPWNHQNSCLNKVDQQFISTSHSADDMDTLPHILATAYFCGILNVIVEITSTLGDKYSFVISWDFNASPIRTLRNSMTFHYLYISRDFDMHTLLYKSIQFNSLYIN